MGQIGNKMETLTPKLAIIVRHNIVQAVDSEDDGEVAERLNAPVLKTGVGAIRPWVRIPPSPPLMSLRPLQIVSKIEKTLEKRGF
jgi:hypothetical protein